MLGPKKRPQNFDPLVPWKSWALPHCGCWIFSLSISPAHHTQEVSICLVPHLRLLQVDVDANMDSELFQNGVKRTHLVMLTQCEQEWH